MAGLNLDDLKGSIESKITELEAGIEKERAEAKQQAAKAENEIRNPGPVQRVEIREKAQARISEALDTLNDLKQKLGS